jgi:hypothetical protein
VEVDRLEDVLEGMVRQFAYWSEGGGGCWTAGLSALEDAFDALGWEDPHPAPEARCDEPGCMKRADLRMADASRWDRSERGLPPDMRGAHARRHRRRRPMTSPTIAEVWEALAYGRTMAQSADEKDWWNRLLVRLDPDTMTIVTRDSLAGPRCVCGMVRHHVSHELVTNSPEGPEYQDIDHHAYSPILTALREAQR